MPAARPVVVVSMARNHKKNHARKMALGGIFSAVSVLIMLMGGMLPIATFSAPAFAGLCIIPIIAELGTKLALIAYAAISILSFLLVPDREMVLFFILLLGYFPVIQPYLQKIKNHILRYIIKLALFNASLAIIYAILLTLFTTPEAMQQLLHYSWWMLAGMLILANITFILYDILIDKVRIIYKYRIQNRFFKNL